MKMAECRFHEDPLHRLDEQTVKVGRRGRGGRLKRAISIANLCLDIGGDLLLI